MSQFLELCGFGRRSGCLPLFGDLATHRSNGDGQSDASLEMAWMFGTIARVFKQ